MATIWTGFLLGIGLMLAFALGPHLLRLSFFSGLIVAAIAVAVAATYLGSAVVH